MRQTKLPDYLASLIHEVADERDRQDAQHGKQGHPSVVDAFDEFVPTARESAVCREHGVPLPEVARYLCQAAFTRGEGTWAHIEVEELAEVIAAPDDAARRVELVQLMAVCAAHIQDIDENAAAAKEAADAPV